MPGIDPRLTSAFTQFTSTQSASPGKVDRAEAAQLIDIADKLNDMSVKCCGLFGGTRGDKHLRNLLQANQAKFEPDANNLVTFWLRNHRMPEGSTASTSTNGASGTNGTAGPTTTTAAGEKLAGQWKTAKETWHCHWFPMRATRPGGDTVNNLYAEGGALAKYDQAFGAQSRSFELANNAKAHDSDRAKFGWWGHCNNASEVACMLQEPQRAVTVNGVTFSPHDISGLLVKVSDSLADRVDFRGNRYNGPSDDPNDPSPVDFMKMVKEWGTEAQNPIPFVLDIDRTEQVWNYPYDQGKIYESDKAPADVDTSGVPTDGNVKYYRAELKGTGFDEQARTYQYWIQYDGSGNAGKSGWLVGNDDKVSPDFGWRPHPRGDLSRPENWKTDARKQNNPHVLAENVYKIYRDSVA